MPKDNSHLDPNKPLTLKQEQFVNEYIKTGNGTQSAMEVYATNNEVTAGAVAYENLKKPHVATAIARKTLEMREILKPERIISDMVDIQAEARSDGAYGAAVKVSELLGKAAGLWDRDPDQADRIQINIVK